MNNDEIKQKILSQCTVTETCIIWEGAVTNGYGKITVNGKTWWIHRLIYFMETGLIPNHIDHLCRIRRCIKFEHLESVTQAENNRRMIQNRVIVPRKYCKKGHELTEDNLAKSKDGRRRCKICKNDRQNRSRLLYGRKF